MIKKMTPVVLSEAASEAIQVQLGNQTTERATPKSTDPRNYPVFSIPAGKKILVYVPNHVITKADGTQELRMDKPILHSITEGNRFRRIRCIRGIVHEELGFNGECPLCEGTAAPWDLARMKIEQRCRAAGLDPDDRDNKEVKSIRTAEFSDRVLKEGDRVLTFPIAVIETDSNCKNLTTDDKGNVQYTVYWYNISEKQYEDTWAKALQECEDEPETPAGMFLVLSYQVVGSENPNIRDAARAMKVFPKLALGRKAELVQLKEVIDAATEKWTPAKAQETVITNQLFTFNDLEVMVEDLLAPVNAAIALGTAAQEQLSAPQASTMELKKPAALAEGSTAVISDETDLDLDVD